MKRGIFVVLGAVVLFLAGWGASDIIKAKRILISDMRSDEVRVSIGTDSMGNGHLIIKDWQGNTAFEVRGKTITMPAFATDEEASASAPPPRAASSRVMKVESVEIVTGDAEKSERAYRLRVEADDLDVAADVKEQEALSLTVPTRSPYHDNYGRITDRQAHKNWLKNQKRKVAREMQALNAAAAKLRSSAKGKRRHADKLEKEAEQPHHEIRGYYADYTIILQAERDLTQHMKGVVTDVCLTWQGELIDTDGGTQKWSIRSVDVVACP